MADGLDLQGYLLERELRFWAEEGKERTGERISNLATGGPEEKNELAWQEHCLKRLNAAAWELEELKGRGSRHPDAHVVDHPSTPPLSSWRERDWSW